MMVGVYMLARAMTSLIKKSADRLPNYRKHLEGFSKSSAFLSFNEYAHFKITSNNTGLIQIKVLTTSSFFGEFHVFYDNN